MPLQPVLFHLPIYNWVLIILVAIFTYLNEGILNEAYGYKNKKDQSDITFFGFKLFFGYFSKDINLKNIAVYYRLTFILSITSIILFVILYLNYFFSIYLLNFIQPIQAS